MAGSQFHSQHSEVMLNVSENHSSTESSPISNPNAQTQVDRSPSLRPSQSEACAPESIERVEDSYQESFQTKALPQPADQNGDADGDEDEEFYAVSPSGKAKLDAIISAKKGKQPEKPMALPARNPIDVLLDEGAVIASSGATAPAKSKYQATEEPASVSGYAALDAKLKAIDVNARTAKNKHKNDNADIARVKTRGEDADSDKESIETHKLKDNPQRLKPSNSTREPVKRSTKTQAPPNSAINAALAEDREMNDNHGEANEVDDVKMGEGGRQNNGSKAASNLNDGTARGKGFVASASAQQMLPEKSSKKRTGGRPQRQAKQSALAKLKAKHGQADEASSSEASDDSGDDFSKTVPQPKPVKETSKQLPTPVTNGSSKHSQIGTLTGKLTSVKHEPRAATRSMAASKTSKAMSNTAASNQHHRSDRALIDHEDERVTRSTESKPQRPGALKRPARSFSRGRKPQREGMYDLPDETSRTKKRGRSTSKASKASTVRTGSVRHKMQSESTKERVGTMENSSRHPSVSVKPSPKSTQQTRQRQNSSVANKKGTPGGSNLVAKPTDRTRSKTGDSMQANALPSQQKIGSSQANAITIEPDNSSSSSPPPRTPYEVSKQAKTTTSAKADHRIARPQTPAPMPSSPPVPNTGFAQTLVKDKPTIIAFGKLGPRNQGIGSARKTPGSAVSSRTAFIDMVAEDSSTERGPTGTHAAPPIVPSARKLAVTAIAKASGNVPDEEEDVFDAFTKNGRNTALGDMLKQSQPEASAVDQFPEDDGFVAIDDFDDTTLVGNDTQPPSATKEPTTSQIAMPPPKGIGSTTNKSTKGQPPKSLPLATAVASAIFKDTPRPDQTKQTVSLSAKEKGKPETVPTKKTIGNLFKDDDARPASSENGGSKKLPVDNAVQSRIASNIARNTATVGQLKRKPEAPEETAARSPKRTRRSGTGSLIIPSNTKPTGTRVPLGGNTANTATTKDAEPSRKADKRGRPSRRTTQGSQGVDLLGSPYPKEFEVATQTTALETFSQQAGLSSDAPLRSDAEAVSKLDLRAIPGLQPPVKPGVVSSNGKSIPAAPNESSKAVTRIASGPLAQQLLDAKRSQPVTSDPFTSSREREVTGDVTAPNTGYEQVVHQYGITINQSDMKRARYKTREEHDEDPDKTLVEPVEEPAQYVQYSSDSPVVSQPSSASTPGAAAKALEDVGDWRNTLKPHQVHLFDSLVIAAHKLVRHMVDHETAERDIVDDYRRRGEIIVTELQRAHTREYKRYAEGMQGWKQDAANELAAHGRKLKQSMKDAGKARSERQKAKRSANEFDSMLEKLVAGLD